MGSEMCIRDRGAAERERIIDDLRNSSFTVEDLTDNEMAKLHVRHMVGGSSQSKSDEMIYRFEFPERPGALATFLNNMGQGWNITLFHYRNHGSAYARVLVGMQVPADDASSFQNFLDKLGYRYWCEDDNVAYRMFLDRA